jgi:hypothetical protein
MYCSQHQLRKQGQDFTDVKLIQCRAWTCDYCAPLRRKQLMAVAASGKPTACLTLTVNAALPGTPATRYKQLHKAWKNLVKRILRQYKKPANERWQLQDDDGGVYQEILAYRVTRKTLPNTIKKLHYMAFAEETEKGEPHLHILIRTEYIPQRWISQQMKEIISSPIVWIERIKGQKRAIAYVSKYVTKAPAQFGKSRRYWLSRNYQVIKRDKSDLPLFGRYNSQVIRQSFLEFVREIETKALLPIVISRNVIRLLPMSIAWQKYRDGDDWGVRPEITNAFVWLNATKSMLKAT